MLNSKLRFEIHSHTMYSNIRLIDSINRPKDLINRAIDLGLSGIAITDHECLSSHIEVNQYQKKIMKDNPDFKISLGNEIYLTETRDSGKPYYHFILIAKDEIGYRQVRQLSSLAWLNTYFDRTQRVPTLKSELREVIGDERGHLIASTACLGGELSMLIREMLDARTENNLMAANIAQEKIVNFMEEMIELFGSDFYVECAPGSSKEQIAVNIKLEEIASAFGVNIVIGTDAHYLKAEDRFVHKSYLNSKNGDREVDDFYEFSYLQTEEELIKNLTNSFGENTQAFYDRCVASSEEIYNKISNYDLAHSQTIPMVELEDLNYTGPMPFKSATPTLVELLDGRIEERNWLYECLTRMIELGLGENEIYWKALETEARIIKVIGKQLDECLFAYFTTFKHYIDLFWECGSIVGPGRGSATGFLSNYLLGITQLDPIKWELLHWRFLNEDRAELPDIDIDLAPSKRPAIFKAIKHERGLNVKTRLSDPKIKQELGMTLVATFGTEATKNTILTACRGYRSEEFKDGIDSDIAQYLSSLVPQERGFLWSLSDVVYGNPDKDRRSVTAFVREVENYPKLLDIMLGIEGLVNKRSSHASGAIMFDEDPFQFGAFMRSPKGDVITQYDLHMCEAAGMTKYDFLVTKVCDKVIQTIEFLVKDGVIENDTLKNNYDKYLHPQNLDVKDPKIWEALGNGSVLDCFQFSTGQGLKVAKQLKPQTPEEMTNINALMRLMASEKGGEMPADKYERFKANFPEGWINEMKSYGVTPDEQKIIDSIYRVTYGCPALQEDMMIILMDAAHFTLAEANDARKIVGKKQMDRIPELREKMFSRIPHAGFADYIWDTCVKPQLG